MVVAIDSALHTISMPTLSIETVLLQSRIISVEYGLDALEKLINNESLGYDLLVARNCSWRSLKDCPIETDEGIPLPTELVRRYPLVQIVMPAHEIEQVLKKMQESKEVYYKLYCRTSMQKAIVRILNRECVSYFKISDEKLRSILREVRNKLFFSLLAIKKSEKVMDKAERASGINIKLNTILNNASVNQSHREMINNNADILRKKLDEQEQVLLGNIEFADLLKGLKKISDGDRSDNVIKKVIAGAVGIIPEIPPDSIKSVTAGIANFLVSMLM